MKFRENWIAEWGNMGDSVDCAKQEGKRVAYREMISIVEGFLQDFPEEK